MEAPQIQYARTEDGVDIAYWTLGNGKPLILATQYHSSIEFEWSTPEWRSLFERLAEARMVVRYDIRGIGMSELPPLMEIDYSVAARVRDLEAVIDHLESAQIDLLGDLHGGAPSIAYAANYPDQVSHLVLWESYARGRDFYAIPRVTAIKELRRTDEVLWLDTLARRVAELDEGGSAQHLVKLITDSPHWGHMEDLLAALEQVDVTELLSRVRAPTLVLRRRDSHFGDHAISSSVAATIPDSRMLVLDGDASWLPAGDQDALVHVIDDFLRPPVASHGQGDLAAGPFRTILFTDLESSTALTQRLGDEKAQEIVRGHNATVRQALAAHDGEEVKHTGDGIMASFPSAVSAVQAAQQIQRDLAGGEIRVRIGLNAGEPIAEDHDYFGTAVQLAARICDRAEPGQVLVSRVVMDLCAGKTFTFEDVGAATLKGFDEPVALYAVGVD